MDKNVRENIEIYKTYALNNKNKLTILYKTIKLFLNLNLLDNVSNNEIQNTLNKKEYKCSMLFEKSP